MSAYSTPPKRLALPIKASQRLADGGLSCPLEEVNDARPVLFHLTFPVKRSHPCGFGRERTMSFPHVIVFDVPPPSLELPPFAYGLFLFDWTRSGNREPFPSEWRISLAPALNSSLFGERAANCDSDFRHFRKACRFPFSFVMLNCTVLFVCVI